MKTVYLISCVSKKQAYASKARELYISDLFSKARGYVEATGAAWYILSAEHGLLSPDEVIEPYNKTLNTMPIDARRVWGKRVFTELSQVLDKGDTIVFLAGAKYREFLSSLLTETGMNVEIPLEGKRIGEQLSWLKGQANG